MPGDPIFQTWVCSTSTQNFVVPLIGHFFEPHELNGQNVRGVGNKLPLNPLKKKKMYYTDIILQYPQKKKHFALIVAGQSIAFSILESGRIAVYGF